MTPSSSYYFPQGSEIYEEGRAERLSRARSDGQSQKNCLLDTRKPCLPDTTGLMHTEACTRHGKVQARQGPSTGWEMWAQSPHLIKKFFVVFFNESHWGSQTILQGRTHAQEQLVSTKQTVVFLQTFSSVLLCLGTFSVLLIFRLF